MRRVLGLSTLLFLVPASAVAQNVPFSTTPVNPGAPVTTTNAPAANAIAPGAVIAGTTARASVDAQGTTPVAVTPDTTSTVAGTVAVPDLADLATLRPVGNAPLSTTPVNPGDTVQPGTTGTTLRTTPVSPGLSPVPQDVLGRPFSRQAPDTFATDPRTGELTTVPLQPPVTLLSDPSGNRAVLLPGGTLVTTVNPVAAASVPLGILATTPTNPGAPITSGATVAQGPPPVATIPLPSPGSTFVPGVDPAASPLARGGFQLSGAVPADPGTLRNPTTP